MSSSEHISRQFDADLEAIRAHVLQMGGLVESQIKSAVEKIYSVKVDKVHTANRKGKLRRRGRQMGMTPSKFRDVLQS